MSQDWLRIAVRSEIRDELLCNGDVPRSFDELVDDRTNGVLAAIAKALAEHPNDRIRDALRDVVWLGQAVSKSHATHLAKVAKGVVVDLLAAAAEQTPTGHPIPPETK